MLFQLFMGKIVVHLDIGESNYSYQFLTELDLVEILKVLSG